MGFFRFGKNANESDYEDSTYRETGKNYFPQNKGWYTCVRCGKKFRWKDIDVDHIVPQSKGGGDNAYNLQPMCQHCNRSKGNKTNDTINDLKRRRKQMDAATKDLEKMKRVMKSDAKREARKEMSKKDYNDFYGKNRGGSRKEVEKAIKASDKDFNDFINSL